MEFFNGLGKKFSSAARTVQERTRDGVESTRLTVDLRAARSELDQHMLALGRAYYESITLENHPVPAELVDKARNSIAQIEMLTAQQDKVRRQSRCPSCGAVQPDDTKFCANCGHAMPEKPPELPEEPETAEYCAECGAMRENSARFCAVCGHSFLPDQDPPALTTSAPIPPAEVPEEPAVDESYGE